MSNQEIVFPILAPDPSVNKSVNFLNYPVYVGGNRGRGQVYPTGEKSNNTTFTSSVAGQITAIEPQDKGKTNIIIATGGGVVLSLENRDLMKVSAIVIYLSSSIEQILRRTSKSKTRPLLERSKDRRKTISDIIEAREGFYQDVASVTINTNGKKLTEVIEEIVNNIES